MAVVIINFLATLIVLSHRVYGLNVNDILNVNYLPGTLLLDNLMIDGDNNANKTSAHNSSNGNWNDAFSTMEFHRKMMNEYLCRNYVAQQILSDLGAKSIARADKRIGSPAAVPKGSVRTEAPGSHYGRPKKIDMSVIKESLLADQGSSQYKNWLTRTTTLEDIYRHYDDLTAEDDSSHDVSNAAAPDYDGEVTGYAVQQTPSTAKEPSKMEHSGGGSGYAHGGSSQSSGVGGYGYGGSGHGYSGHGLSSSGHSSSGASASGYGYHSNEKSDKGMILKDLFELALTALAFKSFGLFILNVVLCIYAGNATSTTTTTAELGRQRVRRATPYDIGSAETLNAMSMRVLKSIEVFFTMENDDGECLRQTLCENNRFSRQLKGRDRIWLPVWRYTAFVSYLKRRLGISWVAGRFAPTQHGSAAMLDYLRASIMGLGNSKCEVVFPRCSIREVVKNRGERRKRRRRKRHGDPGQL